MHSLADRSNVMTYLADEQLAMRGLVRTTLRDLKLQDFTEFKSVSDLESELAFTYPDLLVVDTNLPGGDVCEFIKAVRHHEVGPNPFVPIIALTWSTNKDDIARIIDSGVDGLLLKPTSAQEIAKYVDAITTARKLFVVTSSYIGPDRRKSSRRDKSTTLIEVPNTLKAKRAGETVHLADLTRFISERMDVVNLERLKRDAIDISLLLQIVLPKYKKGPVGEDVYKHVVRIEEVAADLNRRLVNSDFGHVADLCQNLVKVAASISASYTAPNKKDLQLIKPLSEAILKGFHPDRNEADLASEIAASVAKFKMFQAA